MKKFKTRKEILESPEFARLAFELLQEMEIISDDDVENKVDFFIERKIKQCKYQGV